MLSPKTVCLLLCCALLPLLLRGQPKTLRPEMLQHLTYHLPDLQPTDSAALQGAISSLASQVRTDLEKLTREYTPAEPNLAQTCHELLCYAYAVEGNTEKALHHLQKVREGMTTPADRHTFGLRIESYLRARQMGLSPSDTAFARVVRETVRAAYGSLAPAERGQLVTQAKPTYQPVYKEEVFNRIRSGSQEVVKQNGGRLNLELVRFVLLFHLHYQIHDHIAVPALAALRELEPTDIGSRTVQIPVRDSVKLTGLLVQNAALTGPQPVILSMSPYPEPLAGRYGNAFALADYVYLYVDCRGRGGSEGEFVPFERDAEDAYDVIDWVARQPWCNGNVGMTGGSYLGFVQWAATKKKHPALKAINPLVAVAPGVDFPARSNILMPYTLQWLTRTTDPTTSTALFMNQPYWDRLYMQAYRHQLPFDRLDSIRGKVNPVFRRWAAHPRRDAYWSAMLPTAEEYARLDIPVLTITGYLDDDQLGALYYYGQHHRHGNAAALSKHYLLMGPYDHYGAQWMPDQHLGAIAVEPEALVPIYKVVISWFDWVLKGKAKPDLLQDKVNYFVMGTGQWQHLPDLHAATTDTLRLYLRPAPAAAARTGAAGLLQPLPGKRVRTTRLTFDTRFNRDSLEIFRNYGALSDSGYLHAGRNLVYESAPLPADADISGFLSATLWMKLDAPDADFEANLYERTPDGKSFPLGKCMLRARYRNGPEREELVKPSQIEAYHFNRFFFLSKRLQKGSRIRFTFEALNTPHWQRNYGSGGEVSRESGADGRVVKATIYQGGSYDSRIEIPHAAGTLSSALPRQPAR
jgi:hypothetical protein